MSCPFGRWLPGLLCSILVAGCWQDAEHSNPLDPLSEGFRNEGSIVGRVDDLAFQPVEGALVRLESVTDGRVVTHATDLSGRYQFSGLPASRYAIDIGKDGFVGVADTVDIRPGRLVELPEFRLNALPVVTGGYARTLHVSRWWPEDDLFMLDYRVRVEDPDERPGVEAVWLVLPGAERDLSLPPTSGAREFGGVFPVDSLPGPNLHALIGTPLFVRIIDREGHQALRSVPAPARVIDYTPVAISPEGLVALDDPMPRLQWFPAALPFPFSYRVQVVRDELNADVLVQEYSDISRDLTTLTLQTPLGTGSYYWTVSVVDTYGNVSRSKEAGFRIN